MAASPQAQVQAPRAGGSPGPSAAAPAAGPTKRPSRWATGAPSFTPQGNSQNRNGAPAAAAGPGSSSPAARSQSPLNPAAGHFQGQRPQQNSQQAGPNAASTPNAGGSTPFQNVVASPDELAKMHDKMLFLVAHLIGMKVTATLRTGVVYQGILSTVNDADLSICLRFARQIDPSSTSSAPEPIKSALLVSAKDLIDLAAEDVDFSTFSQPVNGTASRPLSPSIRDPGGASIMAAMMNGSGPAPAVPDSFRTDVDISGKGGTRDNRELQRWGASAAWAGGADSGIGGSSLEGDDATFGGLESSGPGRPGKNWDQFAVNEKLFGTRTNYQEELYTTKLDKSGADFRAREKAAERLAQEIQSGVVSNAHVAEERGLQVDDSGLDEEDKYSGVIRGQNAYVPPGARKAAGNAGALAPKQAPAPAATPSANGSLAQTLRDQKAGVANAPSVSVTNAATTGKDATAAPEAPRHDVTGDFKKFVTSEKEKLLHKKAAMQRQDKDKKFADLRSFSASFTLKTPIPSDLLPILTKDEQRQKDLLTKSPPSVAISSSASSSVSTVKPASTNVSPNVGASTLQKTPSIPQAPSATSTPAPKPATIPAKKASPYALAEIPPFNPAKAAAARAAKATAIGDAKPPTPTTSKFNAAAPVFQMRPTAGSFVPGGAAAPAAEAVPAAATAPIDAPKKQPPLPERPANPFFGLDSPVDKGRKQLTHVKEEFSPFKLGKCPDAASMSHLWGFTGKSLHSAPSGSASTIGIMSPQLAGAIPPHLLNAQMRAMQISSPPPHAMHGTSAAGGPGPASLMRTASSSGNGPTSSEDTTSGTVSHQASSGAPTPVPSSSTSQAGHAGPGHVSMSGFPPHMMAAQHGHAAQLMPQGYLFHHQQQPNFPGQPGGFRFAPGQQGAHQMHPGAAGAHFVMGPNGQPMPITGQPGPGGHFIQMQPFSPQMHAANGPMFSPQMGAQMAPNQPFMSPVFMQQGGQRGTPQMVPGGQPLMYQQMGGPVGMQGQFVPMQYAAGPPQPGQPHHPHHGHHQPQQQQSQQQ